MTTFPQTVQEAAKEAAGNWRKFSSFWWSGQKDFPDPDNWVHYNLRSRDSGLVNQSNAITIARALAKYTRGGRKKRTAEVAPMTHFCNGWVETAIVRVYTRRGNITAAFRTLYQLLSRLEHEAVLDESEHSRLEYEDTLRNIECQVLSNAVNLAALPTMWPAEVYDWFRSSPAFEKEIEAVDDRGGCPAVEAILQAIEALWPGNLLCKQTAPKRKRRTSSR